MDRGALPLIGGGSGDSRSIPVWPPAVNGFDISTAPVKDFISGGLGEVSRHISSAVDSGIMVGMHRCHPRDLSTISYLYVEDYIIEAYLISFDLHQDAHAVHGISNHTRR